MFLFEQDGKYFGVFIFFYLDNLQIPFIYNNANIIKKE